MADVAEQGFCLHCIRDSGLLVRGDPRHEITREGRRYWFPDLSHRDAFLAARERMKQARRSTSNIGCLRSPVSRWPNSVAISSKFGSVIGSFRFFMNSPLDATHTLMVVCLHARDEQDAYPIMI